MLLTYFAEFSTSLLEDRVWLRKLGNAEAATLSRHMVELATQNLVLFALAEHSKVSRRLVRSIMQTFPLTVFHNVGAEEQLVTSFQLWSLLL